jgi:hypothetical protein
MTNDRDKIITEPVIVSDKADVEFGNIELDVNEQGEIVLSPDKPMRRPTIYMSCQGSEVIVEDIFHGRVALAKQLGSKGRWPVELFRMGHQLDVVVTKDEPIKILVVNLGPEHASVGASLVATPPDDSKYSLKGDGTKEGTP